MRYLDKTEHRKKTTSNLIENLITLESDFKHNLALLKIKDDEILRCSAENKKLRETVQCNLNEIAELQKRLFDAEAALEETGSKRREERRVHQDIVKELTQNLNDLLHKQEIYREQHEELLQTKETEFQQTVLQIINRKELEMRQKTERLKETTRKEREELTAKLKEQIEKNVSLRTEFRELSCQHASELSIYKAELKLMQTNSRNLHGEIGFLRENISTCQTDLERYRNENGQLKARIQEAEDEIKTASEKQTEADRISMKLEADIAEKEQFLQKCLQINKQLSDENLEYKKCMGVRDNVDCMKQNEMLREVIKSMRKQKSDFGETEKRVMVLENIVRELKELDVT